ncbi:MAG: hypothetical protein M1830_000101 [Pleopsidium flavum]|nr:MAG: hypothetical protein M1830_000101 [Pleopsidium flavum]
MHDLRRQALESGKTVSKKAQSRQSSRASSRANSAPNSRVTSRNASRHGSDEEEGGNLSDGTAWSVNSIDEVLALEDSEQTPEQWSTELADRIEQLIDRKRSSVQGREESLAAYTRILTAHYAKEEISRKAAELVTAFLKSIKAESSEKETIFALKALAMTLVTIPSEAVYDNVSAPLKRITSDSGSKPTKVTAIHALGTCTIYGGASDDEILENMAYFLEIVSSDGHFVEAGDEGDVVTAALEEWGFLATHIEDLEDESEDAMEAFVEQLESSDPSVQIAAGENIALIYEKSYTPQEEDEEVSDDGEAMSDPEDESVPGAPKLVKRYTAYRRTDQLVHTLSSLASLSTRKLSKKDKKSLHSNFADILNSVENPTRGPRYQNAVSHETGKRYGSRMVVRIHQNGVMRIDKWWKLHRLKGLRRVLQGGFVGHYENNEVVFESLPIMITNDK